MKKKVIAMFLLIEVILLSKTESIKNKVVKNNIVYSKNDSVPFTGEFVGNNVEENYTKGIKNGKFKGIIFIKGERKFYEGRFINGIKNGIWIIKNSENKLEAKIEYTYDKPDGKWQYYKNGDLIGEENFSNGVLMGEVISYTKDGEVLKKLNYKNGVLNGEAIIYSENGNLESRTNFKNGKIDGEIKIYGINNNCLLKGKYELEKRVGKWVFYYKTGDIKIIVPYKDGLKHGQVIIYDKAGLIVQKNYFSRGDELDKDGKLIEKYKGFNDGVINKYKKINKNLNYIKYSEKLGEI